ncbi:TIGR04282 family arsenosugar biosynthesis glycosyltransferase [Prochlorococcus sp. MIT 1223]|uniref:TIGR04282 family arsenosugar biosynthesis glycosyltransferase n=1 Tax=Prochlorococcus sp. MIT 1223 TaxID=3096217 RepID=UPI002A7653D2|nr:TIGR04282 family arsenosugar biosynthesis glycosyltransferase [Prochlorococcus sp. MIT 1223]
MARWHSPNRCKTRLAKDIGVMRAAYIQQKLTNHTLHVAKSLETKGLAKIHLAIAGLGPNACKRERRGLRIDRVVTQGQGNLGLRMKKEILKAQTNKISPIIIIGTDLPTLSEEDLLKASLSLETHGMVIGPSMDGGYWLLGLSSKLTRPIANWPFTGIPWGRNNVLSETIKKANENHIKIHLLRQQNDLDQLEDLKPWIRN